MAIFQVTGKPELSVGVIGDIAIDENSDLYIKTGHSTWNFIPSVSAQEAAAYTPDDADDWDVPPTTEAGALDELAARVTALEDA